MCEFIQYKTEITVCGPEDMLDEAQKILLTYDPTFYKFKRKDGQIKAKFYMTDDKKAALEAVLEAVDETVTDDVLHFVTAEDK